MSSIRAIVICLLFVAGLLFSRVVSGESSDYLMDLWTSDNDLPSSSVTAIAQTPDGYLWVGTHYGLARFDGVRFTVYTPANTPALKHARVTSLFTDQDGALWINTYDNSLTCLRSNVFTYEWKGAQIVGVYSTSNRIYLPTIASGVVTREKNANGSNQWQTINFEGRKHGGRYFCQDASGNIWCLLQDQSIEIIKGTNFSALSISNELKDDTLNCLAADHDRQIWAGTNKRILHWNGEHFEDETPTNGESQVSVSFLYFTESNGFWAIANKSIRHAVNRRWVATTDSWGELLQSDPFFIRASEERNGTVWFRQFSGLFCASTNGQFSHLSTANGLPENRVSAWFQDREGNLWIGLDYGGLLRLRQRPFEIIGGESLKNVPVTTVCEDNQTNIWFGTLDHGLKRWKNGALESFSIPEGVYSNSIFSAYPDTHGRLWLSAGHEDLYFLETNSINRGNASIHGVKSMMIDGSGTVWLGRLNQLSRLADGKVTSFGPNDGFTRSDVRSLAEDPQGAIWIGTGNGLLYRYFYGAFAAFNPNEGTETHGIGSLLADGDGTVWAGTLRGGLLRFRDGKFTRYTTADGLPSDVITQILDDQLGKLWFGSRKGIFYIPKDAFPAFDRGEIHSLPCVAYGLDDGLPTLECFGGYQPCAWRSHDGRLWFATVKGLVVVSPEKLQVNTLAPPVTTEEVLVDGKSILTNGTVVMPPGRHQLEIHFTALSFTAPSKVKFRHRLVGLENEWTKAATLRSAIYGPLAPGKYQFQVIACNNDGIWNETGVTLAVIQRPYFWQTWWFTALVFSVSGLAVAGIVSYAATRRLQRKLERLNQQRAIELERERIAKDIHDDLGAGLTQIMFQSSLARNAPPERMQTDLSQISDTARDMVRSMDEIVWAVDPENDTLDGLVTYLGKYVQDFATAAKLKCRLDLPPVLPDITVSSEKRHNVFLATKETLNNIVKHARATEVLFQVQLQPQSFMLVIKDDGVGLSAEKPESGNQAPARISSGHGLKSLSQRLEAIGGSCVFGSEAGQGTRVDLIVPFNNHQRQTNQTD